MRQANRLFLLTLLFLGFISTPVLAASEEGVPDTAPDVLRLAVGSSDMASRMTAIGFSTLADLQQLSFDIDTTWMAHEGDALRRLDADEAELVLLGLDETSSEALDDYAGLRAVMKYWTLDDVATNDREKKRPGYLLVANASLPSDRVEELLDAALQDRTVLQAARIDVKRLTPENALNGLPIARHDGVENYLRHHGIDPSSASGRSAGLTVANAGEEGEALVEPVLGSTKADVATLQQKARGKGKPRRSFTLYFESGDSTVDQSGFQSVADACRFAATLPHARFVISGHTDTVGSEAFNESLSNRRALAVAEAIRNDERFRDALSVVEFGELRLAVATGDGVNEPMNRRVEITIFED